MGFNNGISWSFNNGSLGRAGSTRSTRRNLVFQPARGMEVGVVQLVVYGMLYSPTACCCCQPRHGTGTEWSVLEILLGIIPILKEGTYLPIIWSVRTQQEGLSLAYDQVYTTQYIHQHRYSTMDQSWPRFNKRFNVFKSPLTHTLVSQQPKRPGPYNDVLSRC